MSGWRVREVPELRGYALEWSEPGRFLLSRRNQIFASEDLRPPFRKLADLPLPLWKRLASRSRLGQRALRQLFYNLIPLPNGDLFATYDRLLGSFRNGRFHPLEGLARPCRVLRGSLALDSEGRLHFGEYLPNVERSPIRIYRALPGDDRAQLVFTFPQGGVQHVHGIYPDSFDPGVLWCLTGDVRGECRFLRSRDGCESFEAIGEGDETWRAMSPIFTPTHIYYAMDAELETNRVFRWERASGRREELGTVDGPVYYTAALGEDRFFAVTAELCPSQIGRNATLCHHRPGQALQPVWSREKDRWSIHLLPGTLHFPAGPGLADRIHFQAVALRGADARVFVLERGGAAA